MQLLFNRRLFALSFFVLSAPIHAQNMKTILTDRVETFQQVVGIAAFQMEKGEITLSTAGFQDAAQSRPISSSTLFEIGSVSKTMTALVLADMVIKGEVSLDDPVEKFLPANLKVRDRYDAPVRLIDLATHRSGLPRLSANLVVEGRADPYATYSEAMMFEALHMRATGDVAARGVRGEKFEYSNFGYGLLGVALARRADTSFDALLQKRVFTPLNLRETHVTVPSAQLAMMTNVHNAERKPIPAWTFDAYAGAGAVRMSIRDFARYAALGLPGAESPLREAFALTQKVHGAGGNPINPMGLAWVHAPLAGRNVLTHDGGTYGSAASLWLDPSNGRASGVLSNTDARVTDIALHAIERSVPLADLAKLQQKAISISHQTLGLLAGTYRLAPQFEVTVSMREGRLFAQATGQGEFELFAKSETVFFARVTPLELHFEKGAGDTPAPRFVLHQGGNKSVGARVP